MELTEDILMAMIITAQLIDTGKTHGQVKLLYGGKYKQFGQLVEKLNENPFIENKMEEMTIKLFKDTLDRIKFEEEDEVANNDNDGQQ